MIDLGVYISVFNAEYLIEPCIKAIQKVFPSPIIVDVGSEDNSTRRAEALGVEVMKCGRLSGEDYTALKEELATKQKYVFFTDADEVWVKDSLQSIPEFLKKNDVVNGFWKNLKVEGDEILYSSLTSRGAVAWNTETFRIHRTWPREKLSSRDPSLSRAEVEISPEGVWSWHGVLLKTSPMHDKKNRWKKRAERRDSFASLEWTKIGDLPFDYSDRELLDQPSFVWYK